MAIIGHVLGPGCCLLVTLATFVSGLKRKLGSSLTTGLRAAERRAGRMGMIELYSALLSIGITMLTLLLRARGGEWTLFLL